MIINRESESACSLDLLFLYISSPLYFSRMCSPKCRSHSSHARFHSQQRSFYRITKKKRVFPKQSSFVLFEDPTDQEIEHSRSARVNLLHPYYPLFAKVSTMADEEVADAPAAVEEVEMSVLEALKAVGQIL